MTGKHYNWHKNWTFDPERAQVTHTSGFVAQILSLPLAEGICASGKCRSNDGREYGVVTTPDVLQATFDALRETHGAGNAQKMITRLVREAGAFFLRELQKNE
jgi:hypothetical protein